MKFSTQNLSPLHDDVDNNRVTCAISNSTILVALSMSFQVLETFSGIRNFCKSRRSWLQQTNKIYGILSEITHGLEIRSGLKLDWVKL